MSPFFKKVFLYVTFGVIALGVIIFSTLQSTSSSLPKIAIANWGPHSSLEETIRGLKDELSLHGFKEGETISFEVSDVNFEPSLIMQMLSKLKNTHPKLLIVLGTPIAQVAKGTIQDIPIVFADVTDPVEAGLIKHHKDPSNNITGTSDKQDLKALLSFAKKLLPHSKKVGILYATGEANDLALVKMMKESAKSFDMEVIAIPVEHARDVPLRMQGFKDKVDFIYVGSSGPIQPSLPTIVSMAEQMHIPVFNLNAEEVKQHHAFASFGVSYYKVGKNTGALVNKILKGQRVQDIAPIYPQIEDHEGYISKKRAEKLGIELPSSIPGSIIVE